MSRRDRTPVQTAQWHREYDLPAGVVAPGVLAAAAGLVAMWPFTAVIQPGAWSFSVVAVIVVTGITGVIVRTLLRRRTPWVRDLVTLTAQVVIAVATVTRLVAGDTAVLGVIPTETTLVTFQTLAASAAEQITFGSAPLESTPGLQAILAGGFAIVAILLDQLIAQRGAVIAFLLTAVVGAMPMIVTVSGVNVVWFVMLGILLFLLLRQTAAQHPEAPRRSSAALAAGVGVAALASTVIIAPALPVSAALTGTGAGVTVDASLRLGNDLRQPNPVEVLTLATTADTAPYLRLTTLSEFDGRVWRPDRGDLQAQSEGFGAEEWGSEIAVEEQSTSIRVIRMSSSWLPVPYPATSVQGIPATWRVSPENRTLTSRSADAAGNDYTVRSLSVEPTLEQIRATPAAPAEPDPDAEPVELPAVIAESADEVTADATNDYDRLIALQSWFRSEFTYSLETPVEEDFDGTGAEAVARFLDVRSGYCIHFAGAFALMAQSLDMDVRIVVGYLPGSLTTSTRGDEAVYSVSSDQLHSWPEVRFPGIGWVPFEPTASLGVPTAFAAGATTGGGTGGSTPTEPSAAPSAEQTTGPEVERPDAGDNAGATGTLRTLDPTPVMLVTFGVLVVVLLPGLIRLAVRASRRGRARRGDAASAWTELRATMLDLGLSLSDAESPRMRGADLVRDHGVDADAMRMLTDAVEHASYARPSAAPADDLDDALATVLARLRRSVDRPARLRALFIPRSLFASRDQDAPVLA
ncbi:transglutaminaseTgpA domain-containing protein [Microbacterium sp. NPDC089695]|uniref:transglutaminase family protein n=1 Tax=Microbacterium sp. NPDC089695 TaxID=3364198 RepID=UPI00381C33E7